MAVFGRGGAFLFFLHPGQPGVSVYIIYLLTMNPKKVYAMLDCLSSYYGNRLIFQCFFFFFFLTFAFSYYLM